MSNNIWIAVAVTEADAFECRTLGIHNDCAGAEIDAFAKHLRKFIRTQTLASENSVHIGQQQL